MSITFNYRDLKISEDECLQVLDTENNSTQIFHMELSRDGNRRIMFVGFTKSANLCEVGAEFFERKKAVYHTHIFHGTKASKLYRNMYSQRK